MTRAAFLLQRQVKEIMDSKEVGKVLGAWIGRGDQSENKDAVTTVADSERSAPTAEGLAQLNFKVPRSFKRHIKQLAARDSVTLLTMLHHMVDLYEREHGALHSR